MRNYLIKEYVHNITNLTYLKRIEVRYQALRTTHSCLHAAQILFLVSCSVPFPSSPFSVVIGIFTPHFSDSGDYD